MKLKFYPKSAVEWGVVNENKEDKDMYFKELIITAAGIVSLFFITITIIQQQREIDSLKHTIEVQSKVNMEVLMK